MGERGGAAHTLGPTAAPAARAAVAAAGLSLGRPAGVGAQGGVEGVVARARALAARGAGGGAAAGASTVREAIRWAAAEAGEHSSVGELEAAADAAAEAVGSGLAVLRPGSADGGAAAAADDDPAGHPETTITPRPRPVTVSVLGDGLPAWEGALHWAVAVVSASHAARGLTGVALRIAASASPAGDASAASPCVVLVRGGTPVLADGAETPALASEALAPASPAAVANAGASGLFQLPPRASVALPPLPAGATVALLVAILVPDLAAPAGAFAAASRSEPSALGGVPGAPTVSLRVAAASVGPFAPDDDDAAALLGPAPPAFPPLPCPLRMEGGPEPSHAGPSVAFAPPRPLAPAARLRPAHAATAAAQASWPVAPPLAVGLELFASGCRPIAASAPPQPPGVVGSLAPGDDASLLLALSCPAAVPPGSLHPSAAPRPRSDADTLALADAWTAACSFGDPALASAARRGVLLAIAPKPLPRSAVACEQVHVVPSAAAPSGFLLAGPGQPTGAAAPVAEPVSLLDGGGGEDDAVVREPSQPAALAAARAERDGRVPGTLGAGWVAALRLVAPADGDAFADPPVEPAGPGCRVAPLGSVRAVWEERRSGEGSAIWRPARRGRWSARLPGVAVRTGAVQVLVSTPATPAAGEAADVVVRLACGGGVPVPLSVAWGDGSVAVPSGTLARQAGDGVDDLGPAAHGMVALGASGRRVLVVPGAETVVSLPVLGLRPGVFLCPRLLITDAAAEPADGAPVALEVTAEAGAVSSARGLRIAPVAVM